MSDNKVKTTMLPKMVIFNHDFLSSKYLLFLLILNTLEFSKTFGIGLAAVFVEIDFLIELSPSS